MENEQRSPLLDPVEIRVLGALMEKSMTTPDYYPMTLNSLTTACNQKTARKPVVEYDEETVVMALNSLKKKGLAATETGGTSRSVKYRHTFGVLYRTDPAENAVMGLLFLRGPQTAGELNTNSGRMYDFDSLEEVQQTLENLAGGDIPLVTLLPRKPGQKEGRYAQLLGDIPEHDEEQYATEPARKSVNELEARVEKLEDENRRLRSAIDQIAQELGITISES